MINYIFKGIIIEGIILVIFIIFLKLNENRKIIFEKINNNILIYLVLICIIYIMLFKIIWEYDFNIILNNMFIVVVIWIILVFC